MAQVIPCEHPTSATISAAILAFRASSAAWRRVITATRSAMVITGHGPLSKARRAAATAASARTTPPTGAWPMTASVAGLRTASAG